jgi:hypothetical protein
MIVFVGNGVQGIVTRNCSLSINSLTGNDVIEWREIVGDHLGGVCVHDAELLEMVDACPDFRLLDFSDGAELRVLPNDRETPIGRAFCAGPVAGDGSVPVCFPGSGRAHWVPLQAVRQ